MKHIVSFSGGIASFFTAKRVQDKYGNDNMALVFCDTKSENEDLYRFVEDTKEHFNGVEFITLTEGRDVWEVAFDETFLFNSRVANCTHKLKGNIFRKWLKENYQPEECVIHIGFDWQELHRVERSQQKYLPYRVECLLTEEPYLDKLQMFNMLEELGIKIPELYRLGFSHNNCNAFCFKAGIGHFKQLHNKMPDVYRYHERKEQELMKKVKEKHDKDVTILKRVRGGEKVNISLEELRKEFEQDTQISMEDLMDFGACGCFIE